MVAIGDKVATNYLTTPLKHLPIVVTLAPNPPSKSNIIHLNKPLI